MSTDPKYIDIAEFRREGYLQEINRRFLHPLGLALEVVHDDDGSWRLGGVWDCRDDPEGIRYGVGDEAGEGFTLSAHADHIEELWRARVPARTAALGYMVQPREGEST